MIQKECRLLFTFQNTVDVMRLEEAAKAAGLPGRIIPVPGSISAGCGLCYMTTPKDREAVTELMRRMGIDWEGEYERMS